MIIALLRIAVAIMAVCTVFDWWDIKWYHVLVLMLAVTYAMVCDIYDDIKKKLK